MELINYHEEHKELASEVDKLATRLGLKLTKYHTGIGRGGYYRYAVYEGEERPYSSC